MLYGIAFFHLENDADQRIRDGVRVPVSTFTVNADLAVLGMWAVRKYGEGMAVCAGAGGMARD